MDDEYFRGQTVGLGDTLGWMWTSQTLYRAADVLCQIWKIGCDRHSALVFRDPPPPAGESRTREATPEEVAALTDANLDAVSLMLLAQATECRLKGYLVSAGAQAVGDDGALRRHFKTHKLSHLAMKCHLDLCEEDRKTLDGLTEFLEWRGRYPIPNTWERMKKLQEMNLGNRGEFIKRAFTLCDSIFARAPGRSNQAGPADAAKAPRG